MNPRSVFDGMGVYEVMPNVMRGLGAANCQPGYMEFPDGSGLCVPTLSMPSSGCGAGTVEPWPGAGFCVPSTIPGGSATFPGACLPGQIGIPPYCFPPIPGTTTPAEPPAPTPVPVPVPTPPPVLTPPEAPPTTPPPPPGAPGEPSWVLPAVVGVGVLGLVALVVAGKKSRATPNRRRRHRRRR